MFDYSRLNFLLKLVPEHEEFTEPNEKHVSSIKQIKKYANTSKIMRERVEQNKLSKTSIGKFRAKTLLLDLIEDIKKINSE